MFNRNNPYLIPIFSGGRRQARLRFPTDEELCKRSRELKLISRDRPLTDSDEQMNERFILDSAKRLLDQIQVVEGAGESRGEPFDGAEAVHLMNRLLRCEPADLQEETSEGDIVTVALVVAGGETVSHSMRIPTKGQSMRWARGQRVYKPGPGHQWRISLLEPHGDLYNEVAVSCSGYDLAEVADFRQVVPINHKREAIVALMGAIDRMEEMAEEVPEK